MSKQIRLMVNTRKKYDTLKSFNDQKYTGMSVGASHEWDYKNGKWEETKINPNKWKIQFSCTKSRSHQAPDNTGAKLGTGFHWYILADQKVVKIDSNHYDTVMTGVKFKIGHKEPNWHRWSYEYPGHKTYKEELILALESVLKELKDGSLILEKETYSEELNSPVEKKTEMD